MTHKCEYCDTVIESGQSADGIKCTCPDTNCEMSPKIICDEKLCQLKFKVDWYQTKFEEAQNDIAKQKAVLNQFRIVNIGASAVERLMQDGTLEITGIKSFWT